MKGLEALVRGIKMLKFHAESYSFGMTSDYMQIIKTANHPHIEDVLSRYQGEQCQILITQGLPEYKNRSALVYAASLLSNEVKEILRREVPKPLDIPTVPSSDHKVSDVMRTFIQIYEHCRHNAVEVLEERFLLSLDEMIKYKLEREWRDDPYPGLEVMIKFFNDLTHSYTKIDDKYHITLIRDKVGS